MKPMVVPASTANMFYAACATTIIVWLLDQFAHVKIPGEVSAALTGLLTGAAGHFTTDSPTPTVAREVVADAAADAEMDAAERKSDRAAK